MLKPCPFCGGTIVGVFDDKGLSAVICGICRGQGPSEVLDDEAIEGWDKRV